MHEITAILLGVVFLSVPVVLLYRARAKNIEKSYLRLQERMILRDKQEGRERVQRIAYERALNLPLYEPDRTQTLWARAHQGDELAETILTEELAMKTESPDLIQSLERAALAPSPRTGTGS